MRLARRACLCTLRGIDRKIALLRASRLMQQTRISCLREVKPEAPAAGSSRLVRHNQPSHSGFISRKITSAAATVKSLHSVANLGNLSSNTIASMDSTSLAQYKLDTGSRITGRKIAVMASTAMVGAGVLVAAQADESLTEFTRRAYIGIGGGATTLKPRTPHPSLTVSSNTDFGGHIVVGYDFTSRISGELYYADLGTADIAFLGTDIGDVDYQVFGLSAIGYLYNSRSGFHPGVQSSGMGTREGLSIFSRVGLGGVSAKTDLDHTVNHSTHLALGLGAEYGFDNGFAIRGEYRALDTDQHYATVSLLKRFGDVRYTAALPAAVTTPPPAVVEPPPVVGEPAAPDTARFTGTQTVLFELDSSEITPDAASKLDELVAVLGSSNTSIMLEGHTDWLASERYNYDLSLRRAERVRSFLVSQGVERETISVRGYGETRPIELNDTVEGRASNRRVDIRIN